MNPYNNTGQQQRHHVPVQPVAAYQPPVTPAYLIPPTVATTLLITLFFGIFGIIPAATHTSRAAQMGQPTGKYWVTFACVLGSWFLLWVLIAASA